MPIVSCPHCRADLEIDAGDYGFRMQCPACQSGFTPEDPAARPALPPPPPPVEPGTKVVTCTECRGQVTVAVEDLGHSMQCPLCDKVFLAADPDRPSRRAVRDRHRDDAPPWRRGSDRGGGMPRYDDYDDRPSRRSARYDDDYRPRRRLSRYDDDSPDELVSYAKRECSTPGVGLIVIGVADILIGIFRVVTGLVLGGAARGNTGEEAVVMVINVGYGAYSVLIGVFFLYAGSQLREAKQYTVCMCGCIVALLPLIDPCCLLGLIFGIMGLIKLSEARVKQGFEANRPGFDPDGYN